MVNDNKSIGIRLADIIASFIGYWTFIIIKSTLLTIWIFVNIMNWTKFDPYPFILLNLFLSFEAAYATPLILMSSNRQSERDREHMLKDLKIDEEDHIIIADLKTILTELHEDIKLDKRALKDHKKLKSDHEELKEILAELVQEIKKRNTGSV